MKLNPLFTHFLAFVSFGILGSLCGSGMALFISIIAPNMEVAAALLPLVFLPMMLSGGYLVSYDHIPEWFFIQYISPFRYSFEVCVRADLEDNPDFSKKTRDDAIGSFKFPESYAQGIILLVVITVTTRFICIPVMKLVNRKY